MPLPSKTLSFSNHEYIQLHSFAICVRFTFIQTHPEITYKISPTHQKAQCPFHSPHMQNTEPLLVDPKTIPLSVTQTVTSTWEPRLEIPIASNYLACKPHGRPANGRKDGNAALMENSVHCSKLTQRADTELPPKDSCPLNLPLYLCHTYNHFQVTELFFPPL